MQVAAARFTPASLIAAATRARAPGSFVISMTRSNGIDALLGRLVAVHSLRSVALRPLTRDLLVTYDRAVTDDDRVFKALADPTRRHLLDRLHARDGRTLTELESELEMSRFGVMKHLRLLEDAGLVVTRRQGREKLHFLNPVPIRLIHDRWIDKYRERRVSALVDLKTQLEESA
jgi:DNA-binding transcriptional ArsR family regulator